MDYNLAIHLASLIPNHPVHLECIYTITSCPIISTVNSSNYRVLELTDDL